MGGSHVKKFSRILVIDAAPQLQSAGIGPEGSGRLLPCRFVIGRASRIQKNYMSALQAILFVKLCIKPCILAGHKILSGMIALISEASSHDLLHLSIMNINTRPEFHVSLPAFPFYKIRPERSIPLRPDSC